MAGREEAGRHHLRAPGFAAVGASRERLEDMLRWLRGRQRRQVALIRAPFRPTANRCVTSACHPKETSSTRRHAPATLAS